MNQEAVSMTGQRIGNYRVVGQIGEGGMGAVYEAVHEHIGRRAAIKVLHPRFARDPEVATRFLNEARAVNLIDHPGIVAIFEFGHLPDGTAFIVMEYLKGELLSRRLKSLGGRLGPGALHIGRQLASALAVAHDNNVIHRDLKPGNVMLIPDPEMPGKERVKLFDFGIAKMAPDAQGLGTKTRTGMVMGTPIYMAPEQCRGISGVTDRADVYALGVMLYQMLVGHPPFTSAGGGGDVMAMHIFVPPIPLRQIDPSIPDPVDLLVVQGMLAKQPEARPSMRDVAAELDRIATPAAKRMTVPLSLHDSIGASASAGLPVTRPSGIPATPAGGTIALDDGQATILQAGQGSTRSTPPQARSFLMGMVFSAAVLLMAVGGVVAGIVLLATGRPPPQPPVHRDPSPPPPPPAPAPLPKGLVALGPFAVSEAQVTIADFRDFVEAEKVTRTGRWPWAYKVSAQLPMNNVDQALAARYCRWRWGGTGRLPKRDELRQARNKLPAGRLPEEWTSEQSGGRGSFKIGFRCATAVPVERSLP